MCMDVWHILALAASVLCSCPFYNTKFGILPTQWLACGPQNEKLEPTFAGLKPAQSRLGDSKVLFDKNDNSHHFPYKSLP